MKSLVFSMILLGLFGVVALFSACHQGEKCRPCPDKSLIRTKILCPMDCPGVIGCDGKSYCNECIAAQNGMWVK